MERQQDSSTDKQLVSKPESRRDSKPVRQQGSRWYNWERHPGSRQDRHVPTLAAIVRRLGMLMIRRTTAQRRTVPVRKIPMTTMISSEKVTIVIDD